MAQAMIKARTIDEVMVEEMSEVRTQSNPLAAVWLAVLALVLGATLICSAVLLAWPIVARYAAQLH